PQVPLSRFVITPAHLFAGNYTEPLDLIVNSFGDHYRRKKVRGAQRLICLAGGWSQQRQMVREFRCDGAIVVWGCLAHDDGDQQAEPPTRPGERAAQGVGQDQFRRHWPEQIIEQQEQSDGYHSSCVHLRVVPSERATVEQDNVEGRDRWNLNPEPQSS